jgi:hypothetical protein
MIKEFVILFPTGMRFLSSLKHPDQPWGHWGLSSGVEQLGYEADPAA